MPVMGARAAGDLHEKFHLPFCWLRVLDLLQSSGRRDHVVFLHFVSLARACLERADTKP